MKSENKLEGASNYKAWKKRINIILAKHKFLDLVQGKVKKPIDDAKKEKFRETNILAMNLIVWSKGQSNLIHIQYKFCSRNV